jgi:dGTPase
MEQAKQVIADLFAAYCNSPDHMQSEAPEPDGTVRTPRVVSLERRVADYIAGMTDRFALREHERLTGRRLFAV